MKNIDIYIDIDMASPENIDVDIDKDILKNIDIDVINLNEEADASQQWAIDERSQIVFCDKIAKFSLLSRAWACC